MGLLPRNSEISLDIVPDQEKIPAFQGKYDSYIGYKERHHRDSILWCLHYFRYTCLA